MHANALCSHKLRQVAGWIALDCKIEVAQAQSPGVHDRSQLDQHVNDSQAF